MWRDIGLDDWLFDMDQPDEVARIVPTVLALAQDPQTSDNLVHPSLAADAETQVGGGPDARLLAKTVLRPSRTVSDLTSDRSFINYPSPGSPIPLIRNEELILILAEANLGLNNPANAAAYVNYIRRTSGKLAPIATVYDFEKFLAAVQANDTVGNEDGIPVLRYESVKVAEVPVGLGPLHTQFDDQGYAYTSLFVESAVAKWKLGPFDGHDSALVVAKIPVHFSIGHLVVAHGDTRHPVGRYLVAMNKLSKGRHLNVGPSQPESSQLIDITGAGMTMLYEAYTEPEPHFAQLVRADLLTPIEVYPKEENTNPNAIWAATDAAIVRTGTTVRIRMFAIRSYFSPGEIEVQQGDSVIIHITNGEQERDMLHGIGIAGYNINVVVDPGETKTIAFRATKPGVWPFYCTNFCSAMHQEMQGYLLIKPRGGGAAAGGM